MDTFKIGDRVVGVDTELLLYRFVGVEGTVTKVYGSGKDESTGDCWYEVTFDNGEDDTGNVGDFRLIATPVTETPVTNTVQFKLQEIERLVKEIKEVLY